MEDNNNDTNDSILSLAKQRCNELELKNDNEDPIKSYYLLEEELITKIKEKNQKFLKFEIYKLLYTSFFTTKSKETEIKRLEIEKKLRENFYKFYFSIDYKDNMKKLFIAKTGTVETDKTQNIFRQKLKIVHNTIWNVCLKTIINNYIEIGLVPYFLLCFEKKLLMNKVDIIMQRDYHYPLDLIKTFNNVNYQYLNKTFHLFINDKINIFDNSIFNEDTRKKIYDFLILSNFNYINENEHNKKIFYNNLKKYIMLLGLKPFYPELVNKLKEYLEINDKSKIKDYLTEAKEKLLASFDKESYNNNFLFLIFSFSCILNSLAAVQTIKKENDEKEYKIVFVSKLKCSAKERQFLNNILQELNAFEINYTIETFVFQSLVKSYTKVLYDENNKAKQNLCYPELINMVSNLQKATEEDNVTLNEMEIKIVTSMFDKFKKDKLEIFKAASNGFLRNFFNIYSETNIIYNLGELQLIPINPYQTSTHICILIDGLFTTQLNPYYKNIHLSNFIYTSNNANADFYYYNWQNQRNLFSLPNGSNLPKRESKVNKKVAKFYGKLLAYLIVSRSVFKFQSISLLGVSLGAQVIKHCLLEINKISAKLDTDDLINNIVFFGGAAVINQDKFPNIFTNVAGRIINVYSEKDELLNEYNEECIGLKPLKMETDLVISGNKSGICENIDMTSMSLTQDEYKGAISRILQEKIKLF